MPILLAENRIRNSLRSLFSSAESSILVSSPFVGNGGVDLATAAFDESFRHNGLLVFLTNLSPRNICQSATDPTAILSLFDTVRQLIVVHLPNLHAKVYIADNHRAIVTSANLTGAGLFRNYEYGVEISERQLVKAVRKDLEKFSSLGAEIPRERLQHWAESAAEVQELMAAQVRQKSTSIVRQFERKIRETEDELIRLQLAGGALHTVFARTIRFLLERHGALMTTELHPLISAIHPDLCDDTVDRIIDGRRYGKKWKHAVRTAQQQLKRQNIVELVDNKWNLVT